MLRPCASKVTHKTYHKLLLRSKSASNDSFKAEIEGQVSRYMEYYMTYITGIKG